MDKPATNAISAHASDGGLAADTIIGRRRPANVLLAVIAERIRVAADHLRLSKEELVEIFASHTVFEGETAPGPGAEKGFIIVETHHEIVGLVGKGALKIVFPTDLLGNGELFVPAGPRSVEILPPGGAPRWDNPKDPEEIIRKTMRELMAGESLSMSLKCQATGAPFSGSEGLVLCAHRRFDTGSGHYFLEPAMNDSNSLGQTDKEIIEFMMNSTAEVLTRAHRIGYDRIVHAAETNSTLTARLNLQLPLNVVEGHLRALLQADSGLVIGDEDMTARLRDVLARPDYKATDCPLAKAAAVMQMEHSILLPDSRDRLRTILAVLPPDGTPTLGQYRAVTNLFFGAGENQANEARLFYHREPLLRALSVALSAPSLSECGDADVLAFYLKTLLDNQRVMIRTILHHTLPPGESLPVDWFNSVAPFSREQEDQLIALQPSGRLERHQVAARFAEIANILLGAIAKVPEGGPQAYEAAHSEFLNLALRAITTAGGVIPSVERIRFFTLPYAYDCATPRLGVVTRKPAAFCGSVLRPEAMAVGALMTVEILWKRLSWLENAFEGLTVAVEGLGNAGKHLVRILAEKGAKVVGVSDSRGALTNPAGFTFEQLSRIIEHKDLGKRLDTFGVFGGVQFHADPATLKRVSADLLVLTAVPGSIDEDTAWMLGARLVCELTGAAVTGAAKAVLKEQRVQVIPDNLASSGGLLVSLSEMLQNSAAQVWARDLEVQNLREQLALSCEKVLQLAADHNVDIPTASDMLALRRMQQMTAYRGRVRHMAGELGERIKLIGPEDHVLVVVDDDEDGAASAAILACLFDHLLPDPLLPRVTRGIPAADSPTPRVTFINESFRSDAVLQRVRQQAGEPSEIRHIFVLDRSFPLRAPGQEVLAAVALQCRVTFVNNHDLPEEVLRLGAPVGTGVKEHATGVEVRSPADMGVLLISPQTLRATVPSRQFPTALIMRELAHLLVDDPVTLARMDWQAAVGSCIDLPAESAGPWLLFFAQFNPDLILETARSIRTVTRAGGFLSAIEALMHVDRPDQLETNAAWARFEAGHLQLEDRVQVLVEKILLENRGKPVIVHFFTPDEVASPTALAGNLSGELDFYHWISERLRQRSDTADRPIIVGQTQPCPTRGSCLAVRIRSPRGVDLMEVGLPREFHTGGLPNTAVAKFALDGTHSPRERFESLIDEIWMKTVSPFVLPHGA